MLIRLLMILSALGAPSRAEGTGGVPPAMPNAVEATVKRVLPTVVKLYGAAGGSVHGYGTGVLVSADGLILTIDSILLDGRNIRAVLADGRQFRAEVVRRDPARELALVRIDSNKLPFLTPEPSEGLLPGDGVVILGNSFKVAEGSEPVSIMYGVLAARTTLELRRGTQPLDYAGPVLVIDAIASNPGMAGGPMCDASGRWVGLIGPLAEAAETNTRVNYAIPAETIEEFLGLRAAASASVSSATPTTPGAKPYTGIRLFTLGYLKKAAYVDRVAADSPGAIAGIRTDDLIVAMDDRRVSTVEDFERIASEFRPGQVVRVTLKRGGGVIDVEMTVGEAPR